MSPLVPALAMVLCLAAAAYGLVLVRDVGPAGRLERTGPAVARRRRKGPLLLILDAIAGRVRGPTVEALGPRRMERLQLRIDSAGRPYGMTAETFVGRRSALAIILLFAGLLLFTSNANPLWPILYTAAGWLVPDSWLNGKARRRQARIDRDLPDFLDVLAVSVSAGVGFRPALRRVSDAIGGPVSDEMLTTLHQIELGVQRRDAFEALRERNDSGFVNQFVTSVLQAEELGVPLREAMLDLSREMRRSAHQQARRRAQRAGPRVSLITTTLIVPGAMALILASLFFGIGSDAQDNLGR